MKIWAFPSFYPYDYPGLRWTGIFAHRQYKGLVDNGADLSVILPVSWNPIFPISELHPDWKQSRQLAYPSEIVYDGIKVYYPRIANLRPNRFVKKPFNERYIDAITNFFEKNKIKLDPSTDIFYSQWLPDSVLVQEAAHRLGVKSAILSIGDDVVVWPKENDYNSNLFKKLMIDADHRFACADYLGKEANKIIGENLSYDVIRWGVDYNFFKPVSEAEKMMLKKKYHFPEDKIVILNVGTAIARKGWLDLLDALKLVKEKNNDFILVAVHAGKPEFDLTIEATKRGLENNFINLAEINPSKLNEIFNAADIFCLPSHWEGLANANIEAMSSGLPVITTNVCGHPELITDNYNGILVPPKQPALLYEKLLHLISDKAFRDSLGRNGRKFIVEEWGNFADNAVLLYSKLSQL